MKQLLWIGCLESDDEFKKKATKGYNLSSAQVSQKNLLSGIEHVSGLKFDSINGSVLPPFPTYADRIIEPVKWSRNSDSFDISVGYRNDKYINRINCKNAMLGVARTWVEECYKGEELIVLVYSMRSAPMSVACYIKKKVPKAKIFLIVTDLPQFMDLGQSKLKAFLKKLDWIYIKKMQREFDGFILYASMMAEKLKISQKKWLLMEGSYDCKETPNDLLELNNKDKNILLYSGKLDEQYGIKLLLDAFMSILGQEYELWFTGGGNAESYIKECEMKDQRIKFWGFIPSRDDVLKLQQRATLLINMRLPSEEASRYCFPSKILEYMAIGIPVLSFRLDGIPDEYAQYLFLIEDESVLGIKNAIEKAISMPYIFRQELGRKAKNFVLENKNIIKQSERIVEFISQIE